MRIRSKLLVLCLILLTIAGPASVFAADPVTIEFWHIGTAATDKGFYQGVVDAYMKAHPPMSPFNVTIPRERGIQDQAHHGDSVRQSARPLPQLGRRRPGRVRRGRPPQGRSPEDVKRHCLGQLGWRPAYGKSTAPRARSTAPPSTWAESPSGTTRTSSKKVGYDVLPHRLATTSSSSSRS